MKISIIGTGYVGLTTGVCMADLGHQVICVDNDQEKLEKLKKGKSPIYEPGLEDLIVKNQKSKNLFFSDDISLATKESEIIFICVNTPPKQDGRADLKYVEKVAKEIAQFINGDYKIIVDKSTVPVKTAEKVKETIIKYGNGNINFDVVSNPEFLKEGTAIEDTIKPDRIVIGVESQKAKEKMLELYKPIIEKNNIPVKITSVRSAELIKHGANTFLATKISFANLIAQTCEEAGADALEVLESIGLDERIGKHFLNPGIGFGGSCFPKDIAAYKKTLETLGIDNSFIESVEKINEEILKRFIKKIEKELWVIDNKEIAVWGLSFKPNTDDIRNSPSLKLIKKLKEDGANIQAYDPQALKNAKKEIPDIKYFDNQYEACKGAEALIICTEWDEFKNSDLKKIKELLVTPIIFDGRNIFSREEAEKIGFKYFGIGR